MKRNSEAEDREHYIAQLFCGDAKDGLIHGSLSGRLQEIQVSPIEGRLLYLLVKIAGVCSIVEVGSLVGYSTICMAEALPENGVIYSIEISEERCKLAVANHKKMKLEKKIRQICGDARHELSQLNGVFDAMFIDGDKGGYLDYLSWADEHIKAGGLIIADNTLLFDSVHLLEPPKGVSVNSWNVMRLFNQKIADRNKYEAVILPMFDGLAVIRKLT